MEAHGGLFDLRIALAIAKMAFYYTAELVRAENEHSDWYSERSEFSFTDR